MDPAGYLLVVAKSAGLFALALILFRVMGKRTLGDMEALDFVVVLVIAEVVGAPLADPELPLTPAVVAVTTLALVQILLSVVTVRSAKVGEILEGKPVVVVRQGKVLEDNLRKAKVSPEELAGRLRERGFVDPSDLEMATLEADGMLSAVPKREITPVTPRFLGRPASIMLLVRGVPDARGLAAAGLREDDLRAALRRRGLRPSDADEVFIDPEGNLRVTVDLSRSIRRRQRQGQRPRRLGPGWPPERETED